MNARTQLLVLNLLGVVVFLALWQLIGVNRWAGLTWPPLTDVVALLFNPSKTQLFVRAASATFGVVLVGYVAGGLAGIALGMLAHVVSILRPGLDRLVSVVHAIPLIALAPLFIVLMDRDTTPIAISALGVFYLFYVSTTSGLAASSMAHRDLFRVLGASSAMRLLRLDLPAAFPALASSMKLAIPVAFIGSIVGEWFGASRGLGLLMVSAMQNFQIPLLWSAVFIAACASLAGFALMSTIEKLAYRRFA
jgi:ABC-type nitrate/sulfonate/bicarbonate transport system permease component